MGLFDLLNPLFTGIDTYCLSWLPAWARVALYGLGSGAATMLLYARFSNQDALTEGKQASKEALSRLRELDPEAELAIVLATMRNAVAAPLKQAKTAAIPALWASLPLVFVLVWLDNTYSYHVPPAGSLIQARTEPFVALQEGNGIQRSADQTYSITWPDSGQIELQSLSGNLIVSIPASTHVPLIHKRAWWNILIGNPAGYLDENAPINSIELTMPARELFNLGPRWLRSWVIIYFTALMATAVAIKVRFKIA
jgi:hypothetical protein